MTRRPRQNFSGVCATIIMAPDRNRDILVDTLGKLGLDVTTVDPPAAAPTALAGAEVIFFDSDIAETPPLPLATPLAPVPLVVMVGLETPSRLQRAFDLGPSAFIQKPVRSSGIYSALFFAMNEHARRAETLEQVRTLQRRRGSRRFVHKALMQLMDRYGLDDEAAYSLLRQESMARRLTIEETSVRILAEKTHLKREARNA